jgi:TATA-box binding protein (TBP) (component of TFIID and TFIIIB)
MTTPYKISTITANGSINCRIDLEILFNNIEIKPDKFTWVQYNKMERGVYPKKPKKIQGKTFDNQVMVYYKIKDSYMPNIKLFKNGNIHMTGIRCTEDGEKLINVVAEEIKRIYENYELVVSNSKNIIEKIEDIKPGNFIVRMFNSGFEFPFEIRRKSLHQILINDTYNNICSFEPLSYPGVKLQYFYNNTNNKKNGECKCDKMCFGKGSGLIANSCKKITIAVFESGSVIITGANMIEQIDESYAYILKVVLENEELIKKQKLPDIN